MDKKTYELYDNYDDALDKLRMEGVKEVKIENRLVELSHDDYNTLKFMNRAERRKWFRKNKKKLSRRKSDDNCHQ